MCVYISSLKLMTRNIPPPEWCHNQMKVIGNTVKTLAQNLYIKVHSLQDKDHTSCDA